MLGDFILKSFNFILNIRLIKLKVFSKISNYFKYFKERHDEEEIFKKLGFDYYKESIEYDVYKNDKLIFNLNSLFRKYLIRKESILGLITLTFTICFIFSLEIALIFIILFVMFFSMVLYLPKYGEKKKYEDITQELPYALRHMGIELKSGKGLNDTLMTISKAEYGSLSLEFRRVLEEVKYGESIVNSLLRMGERVDSEGLSRAIQQIIGTLRVGGNLASNLNIIAEDITFDMHIKLKDYSQKLNSFILIYTFLAILAPVILLIMLMAASTVIGDLIDSNILLILYIFFFPMIVIFMGVLIKRLEPKI